MSSLDWRISSFTSTGSNCVAVAETGGAIALRNSNHPDDGTIVISRPAFAALLRGVKAGELDDLAPFVAIYGAKGLAYIRVNDPSRLSEEGLQSPIVKFLSPEILKRILELTGAQAGIVTDGVHTKAKIKNITPKETHRLLDAGNVVIVAGFQGQTPGGQITTPGRGGSDLTAIALAAALQVDACTPNAIIQEQSLGIHYNRDGDLLDYLVDPRVFRYDGGFVEIPRGPGLGIEIDEKRVEEAARRGHNWKNPVWRNEDGTVAEW